MKIALVSKGGTIAMAQGSFQDVSSLSYTAEFFESQGYILTAKLPEKLSVGKTLSGKRHDV